MARFVDLDDESDPQQPVTAAGCAVGAGQQGSANGYTDGDANTNGSGDDGSRESCTTHSAVAEAFQCYPIAIAIVSSIDLNTLDALARASRAIHNGLVQYRKSLLAATLRCYNENVPVDKDETLRYRARAGNWFYMEDGRSYNGKSGPCARDMVGECRRCGEVVCRNCAIKPPAPIALRERHRRLCLACVHAPITSLAKPPVEEGQSLYSEAMQGAVCKCADQGVWLCQPCGRSIRAADHEYTRIWRWRSHYGEVLGGLGTGIGDGDRGVICGREKDCCAAKEREQETDCDAEDARDGSSPPLWAADLPFATSSNVSTPNHDMNHTNHHNNHDTTPPAIPLFASAAPIDALFDDSSRRTPSPQQLGPGYERHEIEGIGGVVKRKLVRMVRIGACVPEWEDEKGGLGGSSGQPLRREARGEMRSWCGWCWRVIPGKADEEEAAAAAAEASAETEGTQS